MNYARASMHPRATPSEFTIFCMPFHQTNKYTFGAFHRFSTTLCTKTENTRCARIYELNAGDIAAIVMSVVILAVIATIGWMYGKTQSRRHHMTANELEMTEMLLGDVTHEKDRITEEHDLMSRAWEISERDLVMGDVIGMGGMGVSRRRFRLLTVQYFPVTAW